MVNYEIEKAKNPALNSRDSIDMRRRCSYLIGSAGTRLLKKRS